MKFWEWFTTLIGVGILTFCFLLANKSETPEQRKIRHIEESRQVGKDVISKAYLRGYEDCSNRKEWGKGRMEYLKECLGK